MQAKDITDPSWFQNDGGPCISGVPKADRGRGASQGGRRDAGETGGGSDDKMAAGNGITEEGSKEACTDHRKIPKGRKPPNTVF